MRRMPSMRRLVLAGVVAALAAVGVALGTPGTGTQVPTPLADVNTANTASMNLNHIKFRNRDPVRIFQVKTTASPGFSSGWHKHQGPVFIAVTNGSFTFYDTAGNGEHFDRAHHEDSDCTVTTVSAPGGYIETAGEPIQVYNSTPSTVNGGVVEWTTTQVIPVGGLTRVDVTPGFCGV